MVRDTPEPPPTASYPRTRCSPAQASTAQPIATRTAQVTAITSALVARVTPAAPNERYARRLTTCCLLPAASLVLLTACYITYILTTCYLLFATCHQLRAACYLLLATCYLLLATCYLLLAIFYLLLATHYMLLATHYLLLTTHYSLLTTHYSPPTTHYSAVRYLPLTAGGRSGPSAQWPVSVLHDTTYMVYKLPGRMFGSLQASAVGKVGSELTVGAGGRDCSSSGSSSERAHSRSAACGGCLQQLHYTQGEH